MMKMLRIEYLLDTRTVYNCRIAISINRCVSATNAADKYWGRIHGVDVLSILIRNIKEDLRRHKKQAVVAPIDVFEFDINDNELNIWHLKYNGEKDYLVATIIDI